MSKTMLSLKVIGLAALGASSVLWILPKKGRAGEPALVAPKEIRFALYSVPPVLSVTQHADISMFSILSSVHLGLLTEDYQGALYSGAASSWSVSPDGLVYSFTLDETLKFHNGKQLTCADVKYSFDRLKDLGNQYTWNSGIDQIKCIDDSNVSISLRRPSTSFLPALAGLEAAILPSNEKNQDATNVGLGPYKIVSFDAATKAPVLERVVNHPLLRDYSPEKVVFKLYPSFSAASAAFDRHEVDIVPRRGADAASPQAKLVETLGYSRLWFLLFGDSGSTISKNNRQCLNRNVDRIALSSAASDGSSSTMIPAFGVVPPLSPGALSSLHGGRPGEHCQGGNDSEVEILYIDGQVGPGFIAALSETLANNGYNGRFVGLQKPDFIKRIMSRKFQAILASYGLTVAPELTLRNFYGSDTLVPFAPKSGPFYDNTLKEIESSVTEVERAAKINALQNEVAKEPTFIPLTFQRMSYEMNPCLDMQGVRTRTAGEQFQDIGMFSKCEGR